MNEQKGRMQTKIELTLKQSQQGVSNNVLVSIEGVEELKRNVWIKGENKAALQTLLGRNQNPPYKLDWKDIEVPVSKENPITTTARIHETYKNVSQEIRDQLNAEAEAVQTTLIGIDNDIYSTVDAFSNACKMWKAIERLKQRESINVQDLKTNLYWEFRKFTSHDGESLESYYSRFYKMMNELIRNQCKVTNHQVNV
nr:hypothetical protein [Tanacetum cinerariifolium]